MPGITGWYLEGTLTDDLSIDMRMSRGLSLQFLQSLDGARKIDGRRLRPFIGGNVYLSCFPDGARQERQFRKKAQLRYVGIWATPEKIAAHYLSSEDAGSEEISHFLSGTLGAPIELEAPLSIRMQRALDDLFRNEFEGPLLEEFVRIKMSELICAAIPMLQSAPGPVDATSRPMRDALKVQRAAALLESDLAAPPNCRALARQVGIGHNRLAQLFSEIYGCSIHQYSKRCRMKQAELLIGSGRHSLSDVAEMTGYTCQSSFSRAYRDYFGCRPSDRRPRANHK